MPGLFEPFVIETRVVGLADSEGGLSRSLFQHILDKGHYDDRNRVHCNEVCKVLQNIVRPIRISLSIRQKCESCARHTTTVIPKAVGTLLAAAILHQSVVGVQMRLKRLDSIDRSLHSDGRWRFFFLFLRRVAVSNFYFFETILHFFFL